jgi:hypothetical protein
MLPVAAPSLLTHGTRFCKHLFAFQMTPMSKHEEANGKYGTLETVETEPQPRSWIVVTVVLFSVFKRSTFIFLKCSCFGYCSCVFNLKNL